MPEDLLTPALYLGALAITLGAGYLVYRQALVSYLVVRDFLVCVYVLISFLLVVELWRVTLGSPSGMKVYAPLSVGIGLLEAVFLSSAAVGLYVRPVGSSYRTFLSDIGGRRAHAILLATFIALTAFIVAYVAIFSPYTVSSVTVLGGGEVLAMIIPPSDAALFVLLLFFFLAYPTTLLFLAGRRVPNALLRSSLLSLPIGWAGASILYVVFEGLVWFRTVDATGIMYFSNAILFFFVTRNFRRAAIVAGFAIPTHSGESTRSRERSPVSSDSRVPGQGPALLKADASLDFEVLVRNLVSNYLSEGRNVFVFTSRGSRIDRSISDIARLHLYLLTPAVSYYKAGQRENEVLISSENPSIILDAIGKALKMTGAEKPVIFFDSLSDLILSLGFPEAYKFLWSALELVGSTGVVSLFVLLSGAQETTAESAILARFPTIITNEAGGLRVLKSI